MKLVDSSDRGSGGLEGRALTHYRRFAMRREVPRATLACQSKYLEAAETVSGAQAVGFWGRKAEPMLTTRGFQAQMAPRQVLVMPNTVAFDYGPLVGVEIPPAARQAALVSLQ